MGIKIDFVLGILVVYIPIPLRNRRFFPIYVLSPIDTEENLDTKWKRVKDVPDKSSVMLTLNAAAVNYFDRIDPFPFPEFTETS